MGALRSSRAILPDERFPGEERHRITFAGNGGVTQTAMQTEVEASNREAAPAPGGNDAKRRRRTVRALLWRVLEGFAWVAFFAFAAIFLALRYWLLPDIGRYRDDVVAIVSSSIGMPVKIDSIEADWLGFRPRITFGNVRISDREGREVLALPSIENVVAWRSLLVLDLRLHSIEIDGPKLAVRRDRSGFLHVAGVKLEPETGGGGGGAFTAWVFDQREITIRDAEIEWIDEQRGAAPLKLRALQFRLRNSGERHSFGLSARPPAELGSSVDLRVELTGDSVAQVAAWNGQAYAELGDTDLAGWRTWIDYPLDISAGRGAVRVWASLRAGQLRRATADVALAAARVRLRADLPVLELSRVTGRLLGRVTEGGYEVGGRDLALAVVDGPTLEPTSFRVSWQRATERAPERGSASASLIELRPLAKFLEYVPVPAEVNRRLVELAPAGSLLEARFDWSGPLSAVGRYSGKASFERLAMSPREAIPGFTGLSGRIEMTESNGTLYLRATHAGLEFPRVFPEPRIALDSLNGRIDWERRGASGFEVKVSSLAFSNAHATGTAFGAYVYSGSGPGLIDLSAQLTHADGRYTAKYLPLASIMGEGTRAWLSRAIVAGDVRSARLRMTGDLRNFPFTDAFAGQFFVSAHVSGGVLDYAEGWPRIEGIDADLLFDRRKMDIIGHRGNILGAELSEVHVSLPDMLAPQPVLSVSGNASGPTPAFLRYVAHSPLRRMTGGFTDVLSAVGEGELNLSFGLPLHAPDKTKIAGQYAFSDNRVVVYPGIPAIEGATGSVNFSDSSLDVNSVKGRLLGGEVTIGGGMRDGADLRIVGRGNASVAGLRPVLGEPWSGYLAGATTYVATVRGREGGAEVTIESSLRGMAVSLPEPLTKTAADSMPLRLQMRPGRSAGEFRIAAGVADVVAVEVARGGEGRATAQRIAVALGPETAKALRLPREPGLSVYGSLPALNLDPWLKLLPREDTGPQRTEFDVGFGVLDAYGERFREISLKGTSDEQGWSANVASREVTGMLIYRGEGRGKLVGRLSRLQIPEDTPGAQPAERRHDDLPAIDLIVDSFALRDKELGKLDFQARQSGLDWQIDGASVSNPDAKISAKGLWRTFVPGAAGGATSGARTSLHVTIDANDAGKFLERIGYPGLVKGGSVQLSGDIAWNGDPVTIDYPSLSGELSLQAKDGQFLKVDPGAGKLVSLMNLQMLPRRLALDFSDVIDKGIQFESISSSLHLDRGVMSTQDFRMRGSAASVEIRGETNLVAETQNVHVRVVPSLGAGAATIAGILSGGIAAAGTLLADKVLKDPLGQIFASEYSITGTWTDPKVAKLEAPVPSEESASPGSTGAP